MDALFCVPGMAIGIEEETAHAPHGQPTLVASQECSKRNPCLSQFVQIG